jgi:hypothetical protein
MRHKNPHAQQARELKKNRKAKARAAAAQRRGRADRRRGDRGPVMSVGTAMWLNRLADEMDRRHGDHPQVPRSEVQAVMRELVEQSNAENKAALIAALEQAIANAFAGSELDR